MNIIRPIVGIQKQTNKITPITIATETGLKCNCNCYECDEPLEEVLNSTGKKYTSGIAINEIVILLAKLSYTG